MKNPGKAWVTIGLLLLVMACHGANTRNFSVTGSSGVHCNIQLIAIGPPAGAVIGRFEISKYEITNEEFLAFANDGGYGTQRWWSTLGANWLRTRGGVERAHRIEAQLVALGSQNPVELVSAFEAEAFCAWLSKRSGEVVTLPSPSEWEYAANAGESDRLFPWGDIGLDGKGTDSDWACANTGFDVGLDKYKGSSPVGVMLLDRSPFGLMDMGGNVDEVTYDGKSSHFVIKGGSYLIGSSKASESLIHQFECKHDLPVNPAFLGMGDGFRIVIHKRKLLRRWSLIIFAHSS
jgi:formylglycine-generating enzyme required for sulfatase activity